MSDDKDIHELESTKNRDAALVAMQSISESDSFSSGDSFMQLYASLMTLLMTFFIIIYSGSQASQAKFELAKESLYKMFERSGAFDTKQILKYLKVEPKKDTEKLQKVNVSITEIVKELEDQFKGCPVDLQRYETTIMIPEGKVFKVSSMEFTEEATAILQSILEYIYKNKFSQIILNSYYQSRAPALVTPESVSQDKIFSTLRVMLIAGFLAENGVDYLKISASGHGNMLSESQRSISIGSNISKNNFIEIIIKRPMSTADENLNLIVKDVNS